MATAQITRRSCGPSELAMAWLASLALQPGACVAAPTGAAETSPPRIVVRPSYGDARVIIGTGGTSSAAFIDANAINGYGLGTIQVRGSGQRRTVETSPAEKLDRVLSILRPAVTELAATFGVSRQAIYAWKSGEPISESNLAKLDDLDRAAAVIAEAGVTDPGRLVRRRFEGGKNLLEIVRSGGSAQAAAKRLIEVTRKDEAQRRALDERLRGRRAAMPHAGDLGIPTDSDWG